MPLNKHKKKINKLLRKKVTVGKAILVSSGVLLAALLTLGAASPDSPQYVARTGSLDPTPIVSQSPVPIVKETVVPYTPPASKPVTPVVASSSADGLIGTLGYARAYGNCVNEPGVNRQNGNPISWAVTSTTPSIGATALWTFNHTGVVTGIWSNGDIEVRHQNWHGGNQHRFPRSAFRGFR